MSNKLQTKDLINVGIFTILYLVVTFIAFSVMFTPLIQFIRVPLVALLGAPIYLLFTAKIKKPFAITIVGLVCSAFVGLLAYGSIVCFLINMVIFGLAEFIAYLGKYENFKMLSISYVIVSFWTMGEYGAYWFAKDFMYQASIAADMDTNFVDQAFALATPFSFVIVMLLTLIFGIVSILFTKTLFKKHFKKAGIIA